MLRIRIYLPTLTIDFLPNILKFLGNNNHLLRLR